MGMSLVGGAPGSAEGVSEPASHKSWFNSLSRGAKRPKMIKKKSLNALFDVVGSRARLSSR